MKVTRQGLPSWSPIYIYDIGLHGHHILALEMKPKAIRTATC